MMRRRVSKRGERRLVVCLSALLFVCAAPRTALSRTDGERIQPFGEASGAVSRNGTNLESRIGVGAAESWLLSDTAARRRAFERLATVGTPRARELLIGALQKTNDPEERLLIVRSLGRHQDKVEVRRSLVQIVTGVPTPFAHELGQLTRETAALILARSGYADAWHALINALYQDGPVARAAELALLAYPPRDMRAFDKGPVPHLPRALLTLGELGDQRLFHALRAHVKQGAPASRAAALVALTRLGALETVPLAERWWQNERALELRLAAAEVLSMTRSKHAPQVLAALLSEQTLSERALELAEAAPHPELVPSLLGLLERDPHDRPRVIALIGRSGGPEAQKELFRLAETAEHRSAALYALAQFEGDGPDGLFQRWFESHTLRRWAVRAAAVRFALLGSETRGLRDIVQTLATSDDEKERAVAVWARPILEGAAAAPASRALVDASTADIALALEAAGAGRFLAARAYAARFSTTRSQLATLLTSGDPLFRAHLALGLGENPEPEAVSALRRLYRFETDARVRRAIVRALSLRREPARLPILEQISELDPDAGARSLARLAHAGRRLSPDVGGSGVVWLSITSEARTHRPEKQALGPEKAREVAVVTPTGLALATRPDPDGIVILTGLPVGSVEVRVEAGQL